MRNELVEKSDFSNPEKNKVQDVLNKSKETALQRYEHPIYDSELGLGPAGWHKLISRTPVQFTPQQFAVFRAVHQWRDELSRTDDESPFFVMPNHAVFTLARLMPVDKPSLYNAIQHVSHVVRTKADQLVGVIAAAKEEGVNGPELTSVLQKIADMREAETPRGEATKKPSPAPVVTPQVQAPLKSSISLPAVRAPASGFWGSLLENSQVSQKQTAPVLDVGLALPLPPLTAEVFADATQTATQQAEKPQHKFVPKEQRPEEDQRTDMFVVKQLGGKKRKRAEVPSSPVPAADPMLNDEVMLEADEDTEEAERLRNKAARKAEKKQKKKEEKDAAALHNDAEPAFDYAAAPSVLHAQDKDAKKSKKDKKEKKKGSGFNAFAGMSGGPKGLPRAQKEIAGRSRTFKS
jgi:exosome complex exonuclease RRP6